MWAKRKSLKNLFGSNFDYNVMFLAIELFHLFQLFLSGDFSIKYRKCVPRLSHLQGIFIPLYNEHYKSTEPTG